MIFARKLIFSYVCLEPALGGSIADDVRGGVADLGHPAPRQSATLTFFKQNSPQPDLLKPRPTDIGDICHLTPQMALAKSFQIDH